MEKLEKFKQTIDLYKVLFMVFFFSAFLRPEAVFVWAIISVVVVTLAYYFPSPSQSRQQHATTVH